jgi:DNA-binding PadR family transcriptional regulator
MPLTRKYTVRNKQTDTILPLDMFLLGLVKAQLITPYDWQSRARISLGASLPAVKRLLHAGLLKKAAKGARDRHEFALTNEGAEVLKNLKRYVDDAADSSASDVESVLRLACMARLHDQGQAAKRLLRQASQKHRDRAREARKRMRSTSPFSSRLGGLYSIVLARCEARQEAAIADELEALSHRWDDLSDAILESWEEPE